MRGRKRHGMRRVAVATAVLVGLSLAAPQQSMVQSGADPLPLSWLWSWLSLPAGWAAPPPMPHQESGTAAGKGHYVPASATRAGTGSGHAPGKGAGQLDAFQ